MHRDVEFEFTYVPGSGCVLATGHGELQVDDRTLDFTLDDYSRCTEVCPDRGTLTLEDDGQSATLSFDGSNQPDYTTSAQGSGELRLECEP